MGHMERLDEQMRFVTEIGKLKAVLRQTVLAGDGLGRPENSAEHSWHLAMMTLVLAEHAPPGTDLNRVTGMVLLHDLVEIDAGDLFLYADAEAQERQEIAERAAADRIFALLPPDQRSFLRHLWDEFTARQSPEAKFARALDRLQPMLENLRAGGGTWQRHGITADQVLAKVELIEDGSTSLGALARNLVSQAVSDGLLAPALQLPPGPRRGQRRRGRHGRGQQDGPGHGKKISLTAATMPMITMMIRRASGGSRRPSRAPIRPPAVDPAAIRPTASQATCAKITNTIAAVAFTIVTSTFLAALTRCSDSVSSTPSNPITSTPWAAPK